MGGGERIELSSVSPISLFAVSVFKFKEKLCVPLTGLTCSRNIARYTYCFHGVSFTPTGDDLPTRSYKDLQLFMS